MDELARQVIDAITAAATYPGERAAHAKGTLCAATFTPTPMAAGVSRAAHFRGDPVRVHVRFSNGSANPAGADNAAREGRGMAVKLYLPDGTTTDIVAVALPAFFVATPEAFLEFARARTPDPATGEPDPDAVGKFIANHPESLTALGAVLAAQPPASYLQVAYNALHSFLFVDAYDVVRAGRYHWTPDEGEASIPPEQQGGLSDHYLRDELAAHLAAGPSNFTLWVSLAEPGDPVDDPTAVWPDERERVEMGFLEITGLADDRERDGDVLVFDPCRVTDGIELSGDAILRFRSLAYRESVRRRIEAGEPTA